MTAMFGQSQADRRLLPGGSLRSPTPYVIAIMTFVMMVVAAAGLALSTMAGVVAEAAENRFVVQLPNSGGGRLEAAVAAARSAPGVAEVQPVAEEEIRATLERWLGPAGLGEDLPLPALINLELSPGTDSAAVARHIRQRVPSARLIAEEVTLRPLMRSLQSLQWLALTLILLMAAATSAAVVLAARGALDTHRPTIEIMHGIGATDEQVASLFQRKIALDALAGALFGGAAAAIVLLVIAGGAAIASDLAGQSPLAGTDLVLLALLPLAAVALATLVARLAVLGALRQSL